ncbi:MAG: chemotaxis protein CheW [Thiotrichales bacterium]
METQVASDPFSTLGDLDRRFRVLREGGQGAGQGQHEWTGVLFRVGGDRILAAMPSLSEIVPLPNFVRVPGVKRWVLGLANLHGALIPIVDLPAFLGGAPISRADVGQRLLVVTDGNQRFGLLVNEVFGMKHYWAGDESEDRPALLSGVAEFVSKAYRRYGEHYAVLDLPRLLAHPSFTQASL